MIQYPKDEDGFISDANLPEEQMTNFKLPKIIHGKIEAFSYLSVAKEFKKQIKRLNRQFMLNNIKELEQVKDYLEGKSSPIDLVALHFLSHSFEVHTFNHLTEKLSSYEYNFEYLSTEEGLHFLEYFQNQDSKEYESWRKNKDTIMNSSLKKHAHEYNWIFFDKQCFDNIITPLIYKEDLALYESINLEDKIAEPETNKKRKLKV